LLMILNCMKTCCQGLRRGRIKDIVLDFNAIGPAEPLQDPTHGATLASLYTLHNAWSPSKNGMRFPSESNESEPSRLSAPERRRRMATCDSPHWSRVCPLVDDVHAITAAVTLKRSIGHRSRDIVIGILGAAVRTAPSTLAPIHTPRRRSPMC